MHLHERVAHSTTAQDDVLALISSIPDAAYAEPSALPGWSISHLVGHLVGNCDAQARQVEYALRGAQIEVYSGGQEFRDSEIERRAQLSPATLRDELSHQHDRYAAAVEGIDADSAAAPVEYRNGTVVDVIDGRWMECLVHAVDLGQPQFTWRSWDEPFCRVAIDYLTPRLPSDRAVRLVATDADLDTLVGEGSPLTIEAPIADIAGFLSDRGPTLAAELELGPYPRGSIRS